MRPRTKDTGASVLQKKRFPKFFFKQSQKKGLQKFFSGDFHLRKTNKGLRKFSARFLALSKKISTVQKIVQRGHGNFRGLRLLGQGLENVCLRTSSRPRTSSSTPPHTGRLFLIAKTGCRKPDRKHTQGR